MIIPGEAQGPHGQARLVNFNRVLLFYSVMLGL